MKKYIFLLLLLASAIAGFAQVKVRIKGASGKLIYLQSFSINGYQKVDSAVIEVGKFESFPSVNFPITVKTPPGMYMIGIGKEGFEFILNEPELEFLTVWPSLKDSLTVIRSEENKIYSLYQQKRNKAYLQLDLLNQVLAYYDPATAYYHTTLSEFTGMQDRFLHWTDSIINSNPTAFISHFIRADRKPSILPGLTLAEQKEFFRNHWFDGMDWMDNTMMTSDVLTGKVTSYLGLYSNPGIGKSELSQSFMMAVDKILPLASQNPVVYDFTLKYLIRGFERFGFDDVILHIATNYSTTQQCENEQQSETLARLGKYKLLAVGNRAPDIQMNDMAGSNLKLHSIKNKKLIIFWASWCPHCQHLMPQIISWSQQAANKNIRVIPISLDEDRNALEKAIIDLKIPWPVLVDYKKWNSQAAIDYNIYATPTMLLLDQDNTILAKPMNVGELMQAMGQ